MQSIKTPDNNINTRTDRAQQFKLSIHRYKSRESIARISWVREFSHEPTATLSSSSSSLTPQTPSSSLEIYFQTYIPPGCKIALSPPVLFDRRDDPPFVVVAQLSGTPQVHTVSPSTRTFSYVKDYTVSKYVCISVWWFTSIRLPVRHSKPTWCRYRSLLSGTDTTLQLQRYFLWYALYSTLLIIIYRLSLITGKYSSTPCLMSSLQLDSLVVDQIWDLCRDQLVLELNLQR